MGSRFELKLRVRFNLIRRFSVYSVLTILLACTMSSYLLAGFLRQHMLERYAALIHELVQSVADIENSASLAAGKVPSITDAAMAELFRHMSGLPETLRANVYDTDQRVVWSSDRELIGRQFTDNTELVRALNGQLGVEDGLTGKNEHPKQEHMFLGNAAVPFVEIYMPVRDSRTREIIGVAEVYRVPYGLFDTIRTGTRMIWLFGAGTAFFLFVTQFWIVRRAHATIQDQQERLFESETLAVIGEMGAAVAHGIRSPLAAIRSSAELWQDDAVHHGSQAAADIIGASEKIEQSLRDLLAHSTHDAGNHERVNAPDVVKSVLDRFARDFERHHIECDLRAESDLPPVRGNCALFEQVLATVITNAIEAMPNGGRLSVQCARRDPGDGVNVTISDTGVGMTKAALDRAFRAYYTTKPNGMGLGLALVRRIVSRFGGRVSLHSVPGEGATVTLELAV